MTDPTNSPDDDPPIDPTHVAVYGAIAFGVFLFWALVFFAVTFVSNLLPAR